jgi:hypothetical protein
LAPLLCLLEDFLMLQPDHWEWFKLLLYSAVAALGGTLGYLMREMDSGNKLGFWPTILQGLSAGFVGGLVYLACHAANLSYEWTGVIVGVCGWLGANASIQFLERFVFKKLGIKVIDDDNDNDKR